MKWQWRNLFGDEEAGVVAACTVSTRDRADNQKKKKTHMDPNCPKSLSMSPRVVCGPGFLTTTVLDGGPSRSRWAATVDTVSIAVAPFEAFC